MKVGSRVRGIISKTMTKPSTNHTPRRNVVRISVQEGEKEKIGCLTLIPPDNRFSRGCIIEFDVEKIFEERDESPSQGYDFTAFCSSEPHLTFTNPEIIEKEGMKFENTHRAHEGELTKLCTDCEKKKPKNGWPKGTFDDDGVTICGRCAKKLGRRASKASLSDMTVEQLKERHRDLGLSGYSKLKKSELVESLEMAPPSSKPKMDRGLRQYRWTGEDGHKLPPRFRAIDKSEGVPLLLPGEYDDPSELLPLVRLNKYVILIERGITAASHDYPSISEAGVMLSDISRKEDKKSDVFYDKWLHDRLFKGVEHLGMMHKMIWRSYSRCVICTEHYGDTSQLDEQNQKRILKTLAMYSMKKTLRSLKGKPRWVAVADETGSFDWKKDAENQKTDNLGNPRVLMWTIVPPWNLSTDLPVLNPYYHGSLPRFDSQTRAAINMMILETEENMHHLFFRVNTDPIVSKVDDPVGKDRVGSALNATLPLVIEYIRSIIAEVAAEHRSIGVPRGIEIYAERHYEITGGSDVMTNTAVETVAGWEHRPGGPGVEVGRVDVLDKNPINHPFMAYPDVLGKIYRPLWELVAEGQTERFRGCKNFLELEFDVGLCRNIKGILAKTGSKSDLLESLYDLDSRGYYEYGRHFLHRAMRESVEDLTNRDLDRVLRKMKMKSDSPTGSKITSDIFDMCWEKFPEEKIRGEPLLHFDFLVARLGSLDHEGRVTEEEAVISSIESILDELKTGKISVPRQRVRKYRTLCMLHHQNIFDFHWGRVNEHRELLEDARSETDEEGRSRLGAIALSLALRGDYEEARAIEDFLWDNARYPSQSRRLNNRAELEIAIGSASKALAILFEGISDLKYRKDTLEFLENEPFLLCSVLKAVAINEEDLIDDIREEVDKVLPRLTSKGLTRFEIHPFQRIAYWYIKTVERRRSKGNMGDQAAEVSACISFLKGLTKKQNCQHNAMGVTLACELIDLEKTGDYPELEGFDSLGWLREVIDNVEGVESTREWVEAHWPDEEDWLRPLNFNYR